MQVDVALIATVLIATVLIATVLIATVLIRLVAGATGGIGRVFALEVAGDFREGVALLFTDKGYGRKCEEGDDGHDEPVLNHAGPPVVVEVVFKKSHSLNIVRTP
jgi:hypothetical protein